MSKKTISRSVGEGGANQPADVLTVQRLLNQHLSQMPGLAPLEEDGRIGPLTRGAIRRFQAEVMGVAQPDGRVDPGYGTMRALNSFLSTPGVPPAPAPSPPPTVVQGNLTPFVRTLIRAANDELAAWQKAPTSAGKKSYYNESNPAVENRLRAYITAAGFSGAQLDNLVKEAAADNWPWSAAFISYCFATAGAGSQFPVSAAHSEYVTALKANALRDERAFPFQAYPIDTLPAEVGDVICVWRGRAQPKIHGKAVTWDAINANQWQHFSSHCDIIVRINGSVATAIGGNLSGRVKEARYTLSSNNRVTHAKGVALIKNYK